MATSGRSTNSCSRGRRCRGTGRRRPQSLTACFVTWNRRASFVGPPAFRRAAAANSLSSLVISPKYGPAYFLLDVPVRLGVPSLSMKPSKATPAPRTLSRLKRELAALGILHQRVAEEAAKTSRRGTVGVTTVSLVLAGRRKSANVIATAKRLLAEAKAAGNGAAA